MNRPLAATIFGVVNIVFGGIGVLGTLASIPTVLGRPAPSGQPELDAILWSERMILLGQITAPLGLLSSGALLAAGIGLLRMQPWGRLLSVLWGWYTVVMVVVMIPVQWYVLWGPMWELGSAGGNPVVRMLAMVTVVAGPVGMIIGLIHPVLLLVFMSRAAMIAAFEQAAKGGWTPGAGAGWPAPTGLPHGGFPAAEYLRPDTPRRDMLPQDSRRGLRLRPNRRRRPGKRRTGRVRRERHRFVRRHPFCRCDDRTCWGGRTPTPRENRPWPPKQFWNGDA